MGEYDETMANPRLKDVMSTIKWWFPWKSRDRALLVAIIVVGFANFVFVLLTFFTL